MPTYIAEEAMIVCKRVIYSGRVQGVGFRITVRHLGDNFDVAGSVRNCADGSVELVVQGKRDQVDGFLAAIARRMGGYIAEQRVLEAEPTTLAGFHIIG
jgi:acylphosphatase